MRWVVSFLLFFAGAFALGLEVFAALALMEHGRSLAEQALSLHRFIALASALLAAATLLSPVNRWRSLGRALLCGAAIGLIGAGPVYALLPDPYVLTWRLGLVNLIAVVAAGVWLDRRPGEFVLA
jgi:hypothetical protein